MTKTTERAEAYTNANPPTRIPLKDFEQDALTGWRRVYCYLMRAGVAKSAKKSYNRRLRRITKAELHSLK